MIENTTTTGFKVGDRVTWRYTFEMLGYQRKAVEQGTVVAVSAHGVVDVHFEGDDFDTVFQPQEATRLEAGWDHEPEDLLDAD